MLRTVAAGELRYQVQAHRIRSRPGEGTGTFDEYRYDALGRRVFSRSRRPQRRAGEAMTGFMAD